MKLSWLSIFFTNIAHGVFYDMILPRSNNLELQFCSRPRLRIPSHPLRPPTPQQFWNHIKFNAHLFWLHNVNKKPFTRYCGRYKNKETAWNFTDSIRPQLVVRHNKKETSQITFHNPRPAGQVLQVTERNKNPWIDSTVTSWWPELAVVHHSIKSFPLFLYYSFFFFK